MVMGDPQGRQWCNIYTYQLKNNPFKSKIKIHEEKLKNYRYKDNNNVEKNEAPN